MRKLKSLRKKLMKLMPTVILMTSYIRNALIKDLFTLLTIKRVESIFKIVKKNQIISMQWIKRREIERKPFEEEILKIELKNKQIDEKILLLKDEYKTNNIAFAFYSLYWPTKTNTGLDLLSCKFDLIQRFYFVVT